MFKVVSYCVGLYLASLTAHGDTIALFYALDEDLQVLRHESGVIATSLPSGKGVITRISLGNHTVYAAKMGSGAVNTAVTAASLLARFRCDLAVSIGPAGGLDPDISTGQWFRISRVVAWQKIAPDDSSSVSKADIWDVQQPTGISNWPSIWNNSGYRVMASGEEFITSESRREYVRAMSGASLVDMNTFGLVVACENQHVPVLVMRVVSDYANDHANEDFRTFVSTYDGAGGKALISLIASIPANSESPAAYSSIRKLIMDQP